MPVVLIVEDNRDIANLYMSILADYETFIIEDVPDAFRYLRRGKLDIALIDIYLPSGNGVTIMDYMQSRPDLREIPIVAISSDDGLQEISLKHGAHSFLVKPINIVELLHIVQELLRIRETRGTASVRALASAVKEDLPMAAKTLAKPLPPIKPSPSSSTAEKGGLRGQLTRLIARLKQA